MIKRLLSICVSSMVLLTACVPASTSSKDLTEELSEKTAMLYESADQLSVLNVKVNELGSENEALKSKVKELETMVESYESTISDKESFIDKLMKENKESNNNESLLYALNYYKEHFEPSISSDEAEGFIKETSDNVIKLLADKNTEELSSYINPTLGVRFTPYTTVLLDQNLVLYPEDIKEFFDDDKSYIWGIYDGVGGEIKKTKSEYYDSFVYSKDYVSVSEVSYNHDITSNNSYNNQYAYYHDAIVVEYKYPGTEKLSYMNWRSLRLVYQKYNDKWYLVGVINSQWTT